MSEKPTLSQKYDNTQRTLQSVVETLTRVDERLGIFVDNLNALETIVSMNKTHADAMATKIAVIESKNGSEVKEAVKELRSELKAAEEKVNGLSENLKVAVIESKDVKEIRVELNAAEAKVNELSNALEKIKFVSAKHDSIWLIIGDTLLKLVVPVVAAVVTAWLMLHWGIKGP